MATDTVVQALAEVLCPPLPQGRGCTNTKESQYLQINGSSCPEAVKDVTRTIDQLLYGPNQTKLKLLLWLLAHRLPMLLLAGGHCLSCKWPLVLSFPDMTVAERHALLAAWSRSPLTPMRQAYKGLKAIVAAALYGHTDPSTGTNPLFEGIGYTPGNQLQDTAVGPSPPGAAALEEVLASATVHLPDVLAGPGGPTGVQAYLKKRGFNTAAAPPARHADAAAASDTCCSSSSSYSSPGAVDVYYDAVIVGSGAGGGVTAAVLAAAGLRVLVLEKSSWVRSRDMSWMESDAFATMYERAGFLTTDDGALAMLAGSTLGGGTAINWTASLKPPSHVRSEWAAHGLPNLGPDSKAFDQALDTVCARLGVRTGTTMSVPNAKLIEGLQQLGAHVEEYPHNCSSTTCSAYCNMGCRSGHKQSSLVFLQDAVRAGAHVLTGASVQRVLTVKQQAQPGSTRARRVVGVLATATSSSDSSPSSQPLQLFVHAPIVVSSCGAINTPALLLRSGITVGGNVGANLRLHPATGLVAQFPKTPQQAAAGQPAVAPHKGISMGVFSRAVAHWDAGGYGALLSVPACQPGLLAAICPDHEVGYLKRLMLDLQDASMVVVFTRDSSSGRVSIDRQGRPVISYWPCEVTRQHMVEGMMLGARALAAAGAVRVVMPHATDPGFDLRFQPQDTPEARQQQLEALITRMAATGIKKYDVPLFSAHQMGSCRMGGSRKSSVCDPAGEVWDVSGLYVADGSTFPTPSGVNPMITIYGVSHLIAQGIAAKWRAGTAPQQQQQKQSQKQPQQIALRTLRQQRPQAPIVSSTAV